jgi:threonine dehydratase
VCDALLAPSPGPIGFRINQANYSHAVTVSDDEALAAVAYAFRELKLVVEPGGAVALAALISGKIDAEGRTVVVLLSGANTDEAVLQRALRN